jgi:spermidine/putrescine transport system permease protein
MNSKKSFMHSIAAAPHVFWAVLFIVLPLLIVIFYAFTDGNGSFSFENIFGLTEYGNIFLLSIELSVIATFICLLIGYPLAYIIAKASAGQQKIFIMLLMLPMWTNLLIRTYSIMAILDDGGFLNKLLNTCSYFFVFGRGRARANYKYRTNYQQKSNHNSKSFYNIFS